MTWSGSEPEHELSGLLLSTFAYFRDDQLSNIGKI